MRIDISSTRCKHLFDSLGFKLVDQNGGNEFLYYEFNV